MKHCNVGFINQVGLMIEHLLAPKIFKVTYWYSNIPLYYCFEFLIWCDHKGFGVYIQLDFISFIYSEAYFFVNKTKVLGFCFNHC